MHGFYVRIRHYSGQHFTLRKGRMRKDACNFGRIKGWRTDAASNVLTPVSISMSPAKGRLLCAGHVIALFTTCFCGRALLEVGTITLNTRTFNTCILG